jgi:hypothetical protein
MLRFQLLHQGDCTLKLTCRGAVDEDARSVGTASVSGSSKALALAHSSGDTATDFAAHKPREKQTKHNQRHRNAVIQQSPDHSLT